MSRALSPMPMPEKAPAVSLSWNARAVPMPCAAVPVAKPRARGSRMRNRLSSGAAITAPVMPVRITSTAVSVGEPPMLSAMPERHRGGGRFRRERGQRFAARRPKRAGDGQSADDMAVSEPATSAASIGSSGGADPGAVGIERHGERHRRRAEHEMDELRALEIGGVGRAGASEQERRAGPRR